MAFHPKHSFHEQATCGTHPSASGSGNLLLEIIKTASPKSGKIQHSKTSQKCGFQTLNVQDLTPLVSTAHIWKATCLKNSKLFLNISDEKLLSFPGCPFLSQNLSSRTNQLFWAREFATASAGVIAQGLKASSLKKSETLVWAKSSQQKNPRQGAALTTPSRRNLTSLPGACLCGWQWLGSSAPLRAGPELCNAAQTSQRWPPRQRKRKVNPTGP